MKFSHLIREAIFKIPLNARRTILEKLVASGCIREDLKTYSELGTPRYVMSRPFKGMRYIDRATGSAFLPKVAGTYESEIQDLVTSLVSTSHDLLVDVGAAEGVLRGWFCRLF